MSSATKEFRLYLTKPSKIAEALPSFEFLGAINSLVDFLVGDSLCFDGKIYQVANRLFVFDIEQTTISLNVVYVGQAMNNHPEIPVVKSSIN